MRSCGILLHITSLPSKYGIGTLGKEAYKFVDFLKKAKHKYWQILPLGPTTIGDSPYQSFSAFAGNPLLIDFDLLVEDGLLNQEELEKIHFSDDIEKVDYHIQFETKYKLLKEAYINFKNKGENQAFTNFKNEQHWLLNYSMYMTFKYKFNQLCWNDWEDGVKFRDKDVLEKYKEELHDEIEYWNFIQYTFFCQWNNLKKYANGLGVEIVGDIPIYVSYDSADVWSQPELFMLNEKDLLQTKVAGCPPDDTFSKTGQLWGNPLYNWDKLKSTSYEWWIQRIKHSLKIYDVLRIDHFRGFESFYAIPFEHETAEYGEWIECPGQDFFREIKEQLGELPIIAENLGYITESVNELLRYTGFPGMSVMQYGFHGDNENNDMPHNFTKNNVVYLGTHDNDTCLGYLRSLDEKTLEFLMKYVNADSVDSALSGMIRSAYSCVCETAIIQMQDFLSIGSEGRMNIPSTCYGNWTWRMKPNAISDELSEKMANLATVYFRAN